MYVRGPGLVVLANGGYPVTSLAFASGQSIDDTGTANRWRFKMAGAATGFTVRADAGVMIIRNYADTAYEQLTADDIEARGWVSSDEYIGASGYFHHRTIDGEQSRMIFLENQSGGASVIGNIYQVIGAGAANSMGNVAAVGDLMNAATGKCFVICAQNAVANGSNVRCVPIRPGDIVDVYVDGAIAMGQYVLMPPGGGVAGQGTPNAAPAAFRTIGQALETIGGAGLVRTYIQPFYG